MIRSSSCRACRAVAGYRRSLWPIPRVRQSGPRAGLMAAAFTRIIRSLRRQLNVSSLSSARFVASYLCVAMEGALPHHAFSASPGRCLREHVGLREATARSRSLFFTQRRSPGTRRAAAVDVHVFPSSLLAFHATRRSTLAGIPAREARPLRRSSHARHGSVAVPSNLPDVFVQRRVTRSSLLPN